MTSTSILLQFFSTLIFLFGFLEPFSFSGDDDHDRGYGGGPDISPIRNHMLKTCLVYNGNIPIPSSEITLMSSCSTQYSKSANIWFSIFDSRIPSSYRLLCVSNTNLNNLCLAVGSGNRLYLMARDVYDNKQHFILSNDNRLKNFATGNSMCAQLSIINSTVEMKTCLNTTNLMSQLQLFSFPNLSG